MGENNGSGLSVSQQTELKTIDSEVSEETLDAWVKEAMRQAGD